MSRYAGWPPTRASSPRWRDADPGSSTRGVSTGDSGPGSHRARPVRVPLPRAFASLGTPDHALTGIPTGIALGSRVRSAWWSRTPHGAPSNCTRARTQAPATNTRLAFSVSAGGRQEAGPGPAVWRDATTSQAGPPRAVTPRRPRAHTQTPRSDGMRASRRPHRRGGLAVLSAAAPRSDCVERSVTRADTRGSICLGQHRHRRRPYTFCIRT